MDVWHKANKGLLGQEGEILLKTVVLYPAQDIKNLGIGSLTLNKNLNSKQQSSTFDMNNAYSLSNFMHKLLITPPLYFYQWTSAHNRLTNCYAPKAAKSCITPSIYEECHWYTNWPHSACKCRWLVSWEGTSCILTMFWVQQISLVPVPNYSVVLCLWTGVPIH